MKCLYCDGKISSQRTLEFIKKFISVFLENGFILIVYALSAPIMGFIFGLPAGAIFGIDWAPLPYTCYIGLGLGVIFDIILGINRFYVWINKKIKTYGKEFAYTAIKHQMFYERNEYWFCSSACKADFTNEYNKKKDKIMKEFQIENEKKAQSLEDKRLHRVKLKRKREEMEKEESLRIEKEEKIRKEEEERLKKLRENEFLEVEEDNGIIEVDKTNYSPSVIVATDNVSCKKTVLPSAPEIKGEPANPITKNVSVNQPKCCICLIGNSNIIFYPCKHICVCSNESCLKPIKERKFNCPICRTKVCGWDNVFIS